MRNFSSTTDRAPTTFRLLSTTGREAFSTQAQVQLISNIFKVYSRDYAFPTWATPGKLRDAAGRKPGEPGYDVSTLQVAGGLDAAATSGRDAQLRALKRKHLGACSVRRNWYRDF